MTLLFKRYIYMICETTIKYEINTTPSQSDLKMRILLTLQYG